MKRDGVKADLARLGVRPSKHRGQNFVIDPSVIASIIDFGRPQEASSLVEIGPGLGALTAELQRHGKLTAIEIETAFAEELCKKFPQVKVLNEDVRNVDFSDLGEELTVFGNLPYAFSTDIVFHLVEHAQVVRRAVLLLQREFSARVGARPEGRDFGTLSVSCQLVADVRLGPVFPGDAFRPIARVESQLVELKFHAPQRYSIEERSWIRRVVLAAFQQRRRKIVNSLKASGIAPEAVLLQALAAAGISADLRAERVSVEQYVVFAKEMLSLLK